MRWAHGVPDHMIQAPVCLASVDSPVVLGSKGQRTIQCGGSLMGVPEVALGSLALQSVAPSSMYSMPGSVLVGLGFCDMKSLSQRSAAALAQKVASPTTPGCPGKQVNPFVPSCNTVSTPFSSRSTTLAPLAMSEGAAASARAIFAALVSAFGSADFCCVTPAIDVRHTNSTIRFMKPPQRTETILPRKKPLREHTSYPR